MVQFLWLAQHFLWRFFVWRWLYLNWYRVVDEWMMKWWLVAVVWLVFAQLSAPPIMLAWWLWWLVSCPWLSPWHCCPTSTAMRLWKTLVDVAIELSFLWRWTRLTHWPLGDLDVILKIQISFLLYLYVSSDLLLIMPSDDCHRTLVLISQHWFR